MATIGQIVQLVGSLDPNQMATLHQFLGERMTLEGRGVPEFLGSCLVIQLLFYQGPGAVELSLPCNSASLSVHLLITLARFSPITLAVELQ